MRRQQRLFAVLYALLGVTTVKPKNSQPSRFIDANDREDIPYSIKCLPDNFRHITVSDGHQLDGLSCGIALNCTLASISAPVLLVDLDGTANVLFAMLKVNSPRNLALMPLDHQAMSSISQSYESSLGILVSTKLESPFYSPIQQRHIDSLSSTLAKNDDEHKAISRQSDIHQGYESPAEVGEPYSAAMPDSPIQAYLEGFETLLTTTRDKIMQLSSINKGTSDHHSKRDTQPKLIRRIFHSLRMSCNDMFCEGFDLKKIRTSNSMSAAEKQDCAACYPRPNLRLIRDRCKARNAEALQDIYWACGLLGAFAGVAVLIYRVCSCRHQHRSQTRRTPTAQSFFSSTLSIATTASPYSSLDWRKGHEPSMDNTEGSEENLFMTEQRLNRLGLFTREPRKRIRDVFDLESYGSTQEAGGISKERVPVLPRAPNASLRRHLVTRSMEQGPRFRNESIG